MPSCSVEHCWNHYGSERVARTREKEGCQKESWVEWVRLFAKKAIVVWRWPAWTRRRRVSGSSIVEEDSSSRSSRQLQEQDEGSSLQSSSSTQVSVKLIVIPVGPQNVSPVLNGLAWLRATAKFHICLSLFFFLELFGLFQDCSVLILFWWPFLPLFHCEKECLSVPGIRRLFWVVFFSCWQYI